MSTKKKKPKTNQIVDALFKGRCEVSIKCEDGTTMVFPSVCMDLHFAKDVGLLGPFTQELFGLSTTMNLSMKLATFPEFYKNGKKVKI